MTTETTLLDRRVPQPNDYEIYGVPRPIQAAATVLYDRRNLCPDDEVAMLDRAIHRLLRPWIREGSRP